MAEITSDGHLKFIKPITDEDAAGLIKAHESYGDSWKKRGGVGAYMVMIRKFDRMERAAEKNGWDIFEAVRNDPRVEGILDDIRDARRYLTLIESVLREMGLVEGSNHRDNLNPDGSLVSYSDLDNPKAHLIAGAGETVINNSTNAHMGFKHKPDAACNCARCLVMRAIANKPHKKDCRCLDCKKAREEQS